MRPLQQVLPERLDCSRGGALDCEKLRHPESVNVTAQLSTDFVIEAAPGRISVRLRDVPATEE
jgi:hypothetical protein